MDNSWILTYTGRKFTPTAPNADEIDVIDITHALSNICRFTGHCKGFYSVAQHSVMVAEQIWELTADYAQAFAGLMHDASEAYLIDLARPIKHSPAFRFYRETEKKIQAVIYEKFGVDREPEIVKTIDDWMLHVEAYFLMPRCEEWAETLEKPVGYPGNEFELWSPQKAKDKFLSAFLDFQRGNK